MNGRSTQHPQQGLPTADRRKLLHERRYDIRGYEREDGMIDVEGKIVDLKPHSFDNHDRGYVPAGEPLHEMHLRLTIDENFKIHRAVAATLYSPFAICPGATDAYARLEGLTIGPGFNKRAAEAVGTALGCTHITEMLRAMGTVAFQSMWPIIRRKELEAEEREKAENGGAPAAEKPKKRPGLLGSCHAHAPWSEVVKRNWPDFYDPEAEADALARVESPSSRS
jgi:hypothetical protein